MMTESIPIRSIQHWLYCPHRWGLLEIDCAWAENYYVTKADLMHKRVHTDGSYMSRNKEVYTSVKVYNDLPQYGIYGVTDCIEVKDGVYSIVEYKPVKPRKCEFNYEDLMQVFAQKLCADYVFDCDCDGYIYYADVKKRVRLPLAENFNKYDENLREILTQIREHLSKGIIPPIRKGQNCSGCSMKDICIPKYKGKKSFRGSVEVLLEEVI